MTRALALLLVVTNLLLAAWLYWRPAPVATPVAPPLGASPLILVAEVPAPPAMDPPTLATAPAPTPVVELDLGATGCQALGPYSDRDAALAAAARLVDADLAAQPRAVDASRLLGFWVHTPAAADRAAAGAIIERLRAAGVRDYYVVVDGEAPNAVSLGVFSQVAAAEQHAARLRAMGFEIEVGERRRQQTAWWLDFPVPANGSDAAAEVVALVLEGDGLLLQPRACPSG